jgi:hypothetical protein
VPSGAHRTMDHAGGSGCALDEESPSTAGADYFSTRLLHLVKGNEFSRGFDSCFLFELSLRRIEWIFFFPVFTFGHRPYAGVIIFPKGSSRMDEEYL